MTVKFSEVVTVVFVFLTPLIDHRTDILLVCGEVKAKYILAFYNLMLNCRCCAAKKDKSACLGLG